MALTSRWAGFRWGPVPLVGNQLQVLPVRAPYDSRAEAPQPLGLVGAHRSRRIGSGSEFSGIRPFQAGDRLRRINWRVSLRARNLHVVTARAEEDTGVLLVIDALADHGHSGGMGGAASSLDVTVRAGAALAEHHVRRGDRVSLRVIGPRRVSVVGFGTGERHLRNLLGRLSMVGPGEPRTFGREKPFFGVTGGTVVIVLSPMLSDAVATATATLVRRGLPLVVIDTLPGGMALEVAEGTDPAVADLAWRMRLLERDQVLARLSSHRMSRRGLAGCRHRRRRDAPPRPARAAAPGACQVIRDWTPGQWALRATVVAGIMVALLATGLRGVWPAWWFVLLVAGLAIAFSLVPEAPMGTVATGLVLAWWGFAFRDGPHPQALLAAAGLLTAHLAAVLAAYGPRDLPLDPATVRLWAVRGAVVFLAAPAVFAVAILLRGQPEPVGIWVAGLAAALVTTVAAGILLTASGAGAVMRIDPEEYVELVLTCVEQIPRGRVSTYGAIAEAVGEVAGGGGPRQVGSIMASYGGPVPWWRVVRADGSLPPSHQGEARQAYLEEGTPLRPSGNVDIARALWRPRLDRPGPLTRGDPSTQPAQVGRRLAQLQDPALPRHADHGEHRAGQADQHPLRQFAGVRRDLAEDEQTADEPADRQRCAPAELRAGQHQAEARQAEQYRPQAHRVGQDPEQRRNRGEGQAGHQHGGTGPWPALEPVQRGHDEDHRRRQGVGLRSLDAEVGEPHPGGRGQEGASRPGEDPALLVYDGCSRSRARPPR